MDGPTWIGIGVLVGPPLAVALAKFVPGRRPNGCVYPGTSEICIDHGGRIRKAELDTAVLQESLKRSEITVREEFERTAKNIHEEFKRSEVSIREGLDHIQTQLEHMKD